MLVRVLRNFCKVLTEMDDRLKEMYENAIISHYQRMLAKSISALAVVCI